MIAGDDFAKLLGEVVEPYRMMIGFIAATGARTHAGLARFTDECFTAGRMPTTKIGCFGSGPTAPGN
jgi:hypothetical protein